MKRNLRIARELVKIARNLVADDAVVVDEGRIVVGSSGMRTAAGDRMTVYDKDGYKRLEEEREYDEKLKRNQTSVFDLFKKALSMLNGELKGVKSNNGRIVMSGTGVSEGYIDGFSRYGKVSILVEFYPGVHGSDIGVFFNTQIKSTSNNEIVTIEKRFVPIDFNVNGGIDVKVDGQCFVSDNSEILDSLPGVVVDFIYDNGDRLAKMVDEKLYKMNTSWWRRLFNLDRY